MSITDWYYIILSLSTLVGVFNFDKCSSSIKTLIVLVVYTTLHEMFVHADHGLNTYPFYWIYAGVSVWGFLDFTRKATSMTSLQYIIQVVSFIFIGIGIYGAIYKSGSFPSEFIIAGIPFIVVGCLIVLYSMLKNVSEQAISKNPIFIATAVIFIYQCVSFTYLGCIKYLMEQNSVSTILTEMHKGVSILFYATLGYAFLLSRWNSRKLATT